MIEFRAQVYCVNDSEYLDSEFRDYTFAKYLPNWTQYENPFTGHENTTITTIPLSAYDYSASTNVGRIIERHAKRYYETHNIWPVLRICSSASPDLYYLEWNHDNPNNLSVCGAGPAAITWQNCFQWSDYIPSGSMPDKYENYRSYIFLTAGEPQDLKNLTFSGAFHVPADSSQPVESLIADAAVSMVCPPEAIVETSGVFARGSNGQGFTKKNNGKSVAIGWDNGNGVGVMLMKPGGFVGWDIEVTSYYWTKRNFSYHGVTVNCNGFGGSYSPINVLRGVNISPYNPGSGTDAAAMSLALEHVGVDFSYSRLYLEDFLNPPPIPYPMPPSDVDPDNIPPSDDPPVPPTPDDPDPYYDPTSDPQNPQYDPTKNPDDPQYDPTQPHTPYRPPSTTSDTIPPVQPPESQIDPPVTPPSYVTTNDMFTLYNPSGGDLSALAQFLWSPAWSIDTFKKIISNPLDCILGLMVMPHLPASTDTKVMNVGNVSTGVTMHYFTSQFVDFNCGTFKIEEYYASYLDYSPYTRIDIFLPYIGEQSLSTDEVMNKTIGVKYRFDLASGDCVAFITVEGSVLYSFSGNCAAHIPLSANDWGSTVKAAPLVPLAAMKIGGMLGAGPIGTLGAAAAVSVMAMKEKVGHTGAISGSAGLMGIQKPYLIINRPRQALPIGQNTFQGYPSFITEQLGSLTGYTEVESCHLEHVPATGEELVEIERLLKEGVLF